VLLYITGKVVGD